MSINLTDQIVSQFLTGLFIILVLIAVGGSLSVVFTAMSKKFPFSRLTLMLALTPLCLVSFLDRSSADTLYLFSMISVLLGITIDGINHLLQPKEQPAQKTAPKEADNTESKPDVIVWEKAE